MRTLLTMALSGLCALSIVACSRAPASGTAGAAGAASAAAAALLIAPEDITTLATTAQSSGPVITGSIQPEKRADLRAEVAAVVLQVLKENGEAVRSGDLLVRLDDTAIRDSLTSADEAARAAQQALDQAERQVQRLKTLQAQGMTSTQALEDAEIRRNNAQSDLVAARARAVTARQQLRRTEVRAPFDGVVSERRVSVGDTAAVGKELVKVIDPRSMRFEGLVSADRMHELKIGQAVSFRVNGFPQNDFVGRVHRVDAAANATTRQVEVLVTFADPASAPRVAGLFAEGRIEASTTQALVLPESAIVRESAGTAVWRVKEQKVSKTPVQLAERDARTGQFVVLAGLAAGDQVLRNPGSTLKEGQRVEFTRPSASAASANAAGTPVARQ